MKLARSLVQAICGSTRRGGAVGAGDDAIAADELVTRDAIEYRLRVLDEVAGVADAVIAEGSSPNCS